MTGDLRVQVGARSLVVRRPHRIVVGRRHQAQDSRPIGESFLAVTSHETMSRRWFSVEDVDLTSTLDGRRDDGALMIRAESAVNPLRIWDGPDPVRLAVGGRYLAQNSVIFVGDLIEGRIWGARIEIAAARPESGTARPLSEATSLRATVPPRELDLPASTSDVLYARYHRYYRHPPHFDPQPVAWADVAVMLGLIDIRESADRNALRRALKDPQEAVGKVKQQIEEIFPGWLPPSSQTQKTFHDHLRTVLEMRGFFEPGRLRGFDQKYPAVLDFGGSARTPPM